MANPEHLAILRQSVEIWNEWRRIREADVLAKVVGDFSDWNRSAAKYDVAFEKLLQALKPEGAPSR